MREVRAALFDDFDRREVARAERWVGLHPQATEPSGRSIPRRPNETQRERLLALLHSITESREAIFGERLDTVRQMLDETIAAAVEQSDESYWLLNLPPAVRGQAAIDVLVQSRREAVLDLRDARAVLDAAVPFAEHLQPLRDESYEGV